MEAMVNDNAHCVLLAYPHQPLREGIHGLLATTFKTVVMVADEVSLFDSARRLQTDFAVVDLALSPGNGLQLVRRLRSHFPTMKLIIVSLHDRTSVSHSVLEAGANAFVSKRAIATDLLAATDAVLAGQQYVSLPKVAEYRKGTPP
jgi:DNA-binding NarL/FixJ family response regulator